jgi:hypothetical protein
MVEDVFNTQGQPLETMARVMFDKANVQQRIASLERAVDALGSGIKSEVAEMQDELLHIRLLLQEVLAELKGGSGGNTIEFPNKKK